MPGALTAEDAGVDVSGAGLEGAVRIGDTAAGVVVEVCLDIARNNAPQCPDELLTGWLAPSRGNGIGGTYVVDLSGGSAADRVGDTDTVDTNLVDRPVQR